MRRPKVVRITFPVIERMPARVGQDLDGGELRLESSHRRLRVHIHESIAHSPGPRRLGKPGGPFAHGPSVARAVQNVGETRLTVAIKDPISRTRDQADLPETAKACSITIGRGVY